MSDSSKCACGCGEETPVASRNRKERGWVKGHHIKYVQGHNVKNPEQAEAPTGMKACSRCGVSKLLSEFYPHKTGAFGVQSCCKACNRVQSADWRKSNPADYARIMLRCRLKTKFGLTLSDYDSMLHGQGGVCAICRKKSDDRRMAVDHDHKTGKIRGLLCTGCNFMLGSANDQVEVFEAAIRYLKEIRE